jgi:4'-phosphopantetheinyl transferase
VSGVVRVWVAELEPWWRRPPPPWLDPAEIRRSEALVGVQRRAVWVAGRVFVRAVLSASSGVPPAEVPLLADARTGPRLSASHTNLSISHAGTVIAVAVSSDVDLGVDLEPAGRLRGAADLHRLARTVLSPAESRRIRPVGDDLADALLTSWVRKEAVVKALRLGLQVPFGALEVRPDGIVEGVPVDGRPLRVLDLALGAHLVGAVAAPPGREVAVTVVR